MGLSLAQRKQLARQLEQHELYLFLQDAVLTCTLELHHRLNCHHRHHHHLRRPLRL